MQAIFCVECGTKLDGGRFCSQCGASAMDHGEVVEDAESQSVDPVAKSTDETSADIIEAGEWLVGDEITPGLYRFAGYCARKDASGDIMANANADSGLGLTRVREKDSMIELSGEAILASKYGAYDVLANTPTDGTYLVDIDIAPGRYRITAIGSGAYAAILDSDLEIVRNNFNASSVIVLVEQDDFALTFTGNIAPI